MRDIRDNSADLTPGDSPVAARSIWPAVALAVAAPVTAELLSTSCPPLLFFVPWIFGLFVMFYGCGCILVREVAVRRGAGWTSILLGGAALGILEEGISTRAFFDPKWSALGPLADHGRWFGINCIWTLDAILYHAVFSAAIPVLTVYLMFPATRRTPWLSRNQLGCVAVPFAFAAAVFVNSGGKYQVAPLYIAACVAAIAVLLVFAWVKPRRGETVLSRDPVRSTRCYFTLGFTATAALLFQMYLLPSLLRSPAVTIAALVAIAGGTRYLLKAWSGEGKYWTLVQQYALAAGALACLSLLAAVQEFNPTRTSNMTGTSLVAAGAVGFLFWLRRRVSNSAGRTLEFQSLAFAYSGAGIEAVTYPGVFPEASQAVALPVSVPDTPALALTAGVSPLLRLIEILVSATVLIATAPIMLILAILIRLDTPGPALFFQRRLGLNRKAFTFVKFRTLYADARKRFPELYAYQYTPQQLRDLKFKTVQDPRITPQGEWMRKSTLDELPNFWNVLTGEMALVGPRPEIPEMLPYYTDDMLLKFAVRPGITGLAQISGRGRLGFFETVEYDVQYVKSRSLPLDLKILWLTLYKMITRDGAF